MNLIDWLRIENPASGRYLCPDCRGGNSGERSLNVFIGSNGSRVAYCHRASCAAKTVIGPYIAQEPISPFTPNPYRGDRFAPRSDDLRRFNDRFGFTPRIGGQVLTVAYTHSADQEHYVLPIFRPDGTERGVMHAVYGAEKRRKIYKTADEPMISWTPRGDNYAGVWVVEDQISAVKLWTVASVRAVALLGTHLSAASYAEIVKHTSHLTIALDADATAKAFDLARVWGGSFKSCRVQILSQDIKDMPVQAIQDMVFCG